MVATGRNAAAMRHGPLTSQAPYVTGPLRGKSGPVATGDCPGVYIGCTSQQAYTL